MTDSTKRRAIKKAVFPVGGLGTRFLPATKATPKEMLPVVDKPLIQYAVEEAVEAGIDTLIFITGRNKRAIPDHFDKAFELEHELEAAGKTNRLKMVSEIIPPHVTCIYIRQSEALGLGHAVLQAKKAVGDEPFAVILADDLIDGGGIGCTHQMVEVFEKTGNSVIAVEKVEGQEIERYGVVAVNDTGANPSKVEKIVEKPRFADAPSDLGVVGRYVLTPKIFELLETTGKGAGGEYQLTDAISNLLAHETINAYNFQGVRYDCGSKAGFLEANIEFGLKHPDMRDQLIEYLQELQQRI